MCCPGNRKNPRLQAKILISPLEYRRIPGIRDSRKGSVCLFVPAPYPCVVSSVSIATWMGKPPSRGNRKPGPQRAHVFYCFFICTKARQKAPRRMMNPPVNSFSVGKVPKKKEARGRTSRGCMVRTILDWERFQ